MKLIPETASGDPTPGGLMLVLAAVVAGSAWQIASVAHGGPGVRGARGTGSRLPESTATRGPEPPVDLRASAEPEGAGESGSRRAGGRRPGVGAALSDQAPGTEAPDARGSFPEKAARPGQATAGATRPRRAEMAENHEPPRQIPAVVLPEDAASRVKEESGRQWSIASLVSPQTVRDRDADRTDPPVSSMDIERPRGGGSLSSSAPSDPLDAIEPTRDPDSGGTQMLVLGPAVAEEGELVTYAISVENGADMAGAPLNVTYNSDVLEFIEASEGPLLASGGAATQFLAKENVALGVVDIGIGMLPPLRPLSGSGTLCTITFRAKSRGESPLSIGGSRLLDPSGQKLTVRRSDSHVAVQ